MLSEYMAAAMRRAEYEQLEDGTWFAVIPGFEGLWANGPTRSDCERELRSALEDWILVKTHFNDPLPVIDGIDPNVHAVA